MKPFLGISNRCKVNVLPEDSGLLNSCVSRSVLVTFTMFDENSAAYPIQFGCVISTIEEEEERRTIKIW